MQLRNQFKGMIEIKEKQSLSLSHITTKRQGVNTQIIREKRDNQDMFLLGARDIYIQTYSKWCSRREPCNLKGSQEDNSKAKAKVLHRNLLPFCVICLISLIGKSK